MLILTGFYPPPKGCKLVKSSVLASLLFSVLFISSPVFADAPVPTLDSLKGQEIPDSDPVQYYPESAYTLTEIQDADPENLPLNAVTLYDKNNDGTVTPKYYLVNLKDSVTNIGTGDTTKYFEWSQSADVLQKVKQRLP